MSENIQICTHISDKKYGKYWYSFISNSMHNQPVSTVFPSKGRLLHIFFLKALLCGTRDQTPPAAGAFTAGPHGPATDKELYAYYWIVAWWLSITNSKWHQRLLNDLWFLLILDKRCRQGTIDQTVQYIVHATCCEQYTFCNSYQILPLSTKQCNSRFSRSQTI